MENVKDLRADGYVTEEEIPKFTLELAGIDYKFNEDKLIEEFKSYVDATYNQHYAKEKFQATEFIIDGGHGTGFCIGNVLKYAQRYGKKGTDKDARKDLMKVLHYALIQLHVHDSN
jgi:predicted transcriptional regulator